MTSMNNVSIAVLALVGLPLSPAVAVDELTLSGPYGSRSHAISRPALSHSPLSRT